MLLPLAQFTGFVVGACALSSLSASFFYEAREAWAVDVSLAVQSFLWAVAFTIVYFSALFSPLAPAVTDMELSAKKTTSRMVFGNYTAAFAHSVGSCVWSAAALWALVTSELYQQARSQRTFLPIIYDVQRGSSPGDIWARPVAFTLGYCIFDTLFMCLCDPNIVFIAHHIAIFIGFIPLILFDGAFPVVLLGLMVAESTNPALLPWLWARSHKDRTDIPEVMRAKYAAFFNAFSFPLTAFYTVTTLKLPRASFRVALVWMVVSRRVSDMFP